jgi:putative transposase
METRRRPSPITTVGQWTFLTWRLHGSLPAGVHAPPDLPSAGHAFVWVDRYLDRAPAGPRYLEEARIARIVIESLGRGEQMGHYELRAYAVMPNHVHALLLPLTEVPRFMKALKGATACHANRLLGRTGEPFWQPESYDHLVQNEREFERIVAYIENNPVTAGLASRPEEFAWSSAGACAAAVT